MNKAEIQPIVAKSNEPGLAWGQQFSPTELLSRHIGHPGMADKSDLEWLPQDIADRQVDRYERGWWFTAGDPEFWKFQNRLLVPDGKALDLGIGTGRTAFPFALRGMSVVGYENDSAEISGIRSMLKAYDFLARMIELRQEDIAEADLGRDEYDTVLLGQILGHLPSKKVAFLIVDKAVDALKPGGHIWIRARGIEDGVYEEAMYSPDVFEVEEGVLMHADHGGHHGTHGGHHGQFMLFFGQTELMIYLAQKGLKIVHSQIMPEDGRMNIMYGEDWRKDRSFGRTGMITLIAQKPA
ncbi:MAG: class I SAM-dependent methyltransferase [Candidatus Levybacteria bacterium]|nr:class I SAM-dependent methyltransferase [Candidatus Levybacteria bacterium]